MQEKARPSLKEMSGEKEVAPQLELNEIVINGNEGNYYYVHKKKGLIEVEEGVKGYEKDNLGPAIEVTFLRIRRKLRQYIKGQKPLSTQEHTSSADMLTLFGGEKVIRGTNDELRKQFQGLRTVQIVYCLYKGELVRLVIKGASLGSEVKAKNVHDFYSYVSSFKKNGADDHFYEHITILSNVKERSPMGSYFAMNYERGRKLEADEMVAVEENMGIVYDYVQALDLFFKTKEVTKIAQSQKETEDMPTVEYPEDDINTEDIPF